MKGLDVLCYTFLGLWLAFWCAFAWPGTVTTKYIGLTGSASAYDLGDGSSIVASR